MKFRSEAKTVRAILEEAEESIPTVEIKADLLRDFLERLESAEEQLEKRLACLRDREEAGKPRAKSILDNSTWSTLDAIQRTARTYAGMEFLNMENSVDFIKRLLAAVRDGNQEDALHWVSVIDSGWDSRPWENE